MTVYVVTEDNGRIDSIWSTRAKAEAREQAGLATGEIYATWIEEHDVDDTAWTTLPLPAKDAE